MFYADKPINSRDEDLLGRNLFVGHLAKAITVYAKEENFVIALQGEWGSGKSSILNLLVNEIKYLNENADEHGDIKIIRFNPWNFTNTEQLINQFFLRISNELALVSNEEKVLKVVREIDKYSGALNFLEYIPYAGKYLVVLNKALRKTTSKKKDRLEKRLYDIAYRKKILEESLKSLNERIIVIIDDLDRLTNEEIRLVFQLVSIVANLPNITYLLSYDKKIVTRALRETQKCDGEKYLEKVVQLAFDIPYINEKKLHQKIKEELSKLHDTTLSVLFSEVHWEDVLHNCVYPFIKTLRDVKRYYNTFSFMYMPLKNEVSFIDMVGISALRVFAPRIFEWIRENKFTLVHQEPPVKKDSISTKKRREQQLKTFEDVYPENPQIMLNAISSLFYTRFDVGTSGENQRIDDELSREMRIANKEKFDLYFDFSLDSIMISRTEIVSSLQKMSPVELENYYDYLMKQSLYYDYILEIRRLHILIPKERIYLFLSKMVFNANFFKINEYEKDNIIYAILDNNIIEKVLFLVYDKEKRSSIILKLFDNSDFFSFQMLIYLIRIIELTYGRISDSEYAGQEHLISEKDLYLLESVFLNKMKEFLRTTNLMDWENAYMVFDLWKFLENDRCQEYLRNILVNEISVVKYLSMTAREAYQHGFPFSYGFISDQYKHFFSKNDILNILNKVIMHSEFWELKDKDINVAIAFMIEAEQEVEGNMIEMGDIITLRNKLETKYNTEDYMNPDMENKKNRQ